MKSKHSAGGVVIQDGRVLTISWTTHRYIAFPKGGIEVGETSEVAAVREVNEETGYNVTIVKPLGSWTYEYMRGDIPYQKTEDLYLMTLADDKPPVPHREKGEDFVNLWLTFDEAFNQLTFDDAKEALRKAINI